MNTILGELGKNSKFIELLKNVENKQSPIVISGLNDVGMIQLGTAINEFGKKPICILTYNEIQAKKIYEDIKYFTDKVVFFPKKEVVTYDYIAESKDIPYKRIEALNKIATKKNLVVITTIEAATQKLPQKDVLYRNKLHFKTGESYNLEELKQKVYEANMQLPKYGLVTFTWGNVSQIDRTTGYFAIKPSGVGYELLTPDDMVIMDLEGNRIEGRYNPSSDTQTHIELYKAFDKIGGIVHTHSSYATSWAQAGRSIPCYGTTHADYIYGEVPCLRCLTKEEIDEAYEKNTGKLIVDEFKRMGKDVSAVPAVLCKNHGPFAWGKDAKEAVHNAVVLEEVAKMALFTEQLKPDVEPAPQRIQDKHYYRKHGANAYYGNKVE